MSDPAVDLLLKLMTWYRRRFGNNPSRNWPPRKVSRLSYDTSDQSLNGLRLEASIPETAMFGPADQILGDTADPDLIYFDLGLEIQCYENQISSFHLIMDPASRDHLWQSRYKPAELSLKTPDGLSHAFSRATNEQAIIRLLGQPDETGPVSEDRMHTFITGRNWIGSFHDPDSGRLLELMLEMAADPQEQGPPS